MSASRSGSAAVNAVTDRLASLFEAVGGDRNAFTPAEVMAMWPKVVASLRTLVDIPASEAVIKDGATSRKDQAIIAATRLRDVATGIAPRLPIRDRSTLEDHLKLRDPERMAHAIVKNAANATAVAGSIGGFLVITSRTGPGLILSIPLRVATETLVVAAIELKMIGELHEIYDQPLEGSATQRGTTALKLWASYRGLDVTDTGGIFQTVTEIARRPTTRRAAASVTGKALGGRGLRLGAGVVGAIENHKSSMSLGDQVRAELRRTQLSGLNVKVVKLDEDQD